MNDGDAGVIDHDTHLKRFAALCRTNENGDVGVVGLPAVPESMDHVVVVVVGELAFADRRLNVHSFAVPSSRAFINKC